MILKENPLYQQIKDNIRDNIQKGMYGINQPIPKERELCKKYKVSLITIRQAVNGLVNEGLVQKIQGSGTFVKNSKVEKELGTIISFSEDMKRKGLRPGTKILSKEIIQANTELKAALILKEKDEVVRIKRIRYANRLPLMLEEVNLPYKICSSVLGEDIERRSLHDYLKRELRLVFTRVSQVIEAIVADKDTSTLLEIKNRSPILLIKQTIYTDKNIPVEYNKAIYRCDKYKFALNHFL